MIPYIAMTGTDESADLVVHTANRLPIREIYISPGRDRKRTAWTLMVLMLNGCSHDFTTDGATGILQAVTGWIGHSGRLRAWLSRGASVLAIRAILADPKLE